MSCSHLSQHPGPPPSGSQDSCGFLKQQQQLPRSLGVCYSTLIPVSTFPRTMLIPDNPISKMQTLRLEEVTLVCLHSPRGSGGPPHQPSTTTQNSTHFLPLTQSAYFSFQDPTFATPAQTSSCGRHQFNLNPPTIPASLVGMSSCIWFTPSLARAPQPEPQSQLGPPKEKHQQRPFWLRFRIA